MAPAQQGETSQHSVGAGADPADAGGYGSVGLVAPTDSQRRPMLSKRVEAREPVRCSSGSGGASATGETWATQPAVVAAAPSCASAVDAAPDAEAGTTFPNLEPGSQRPMLSAEAAFPALSRAQVGWRYAMCLLWALVVGVSVTVQLTATVTLNERSTNPTFHALYVSSLSITIGAVMILPQAIFASGPYRRPKYMWSLLGGLWAVPGAFSVPAGQVLGVQIVLLVQLSAMLGTALCFDVRAGRVTWADTQKFIGFVVVAVGVALENVGAFGSVAASAGAAMIPVLLSGTFAGGVGYALQAKCNGRLSRDVGSIARAVVVSAVVNGVCTAPLLTYIRFGMSVEFVFHPHDWPLWLFGGFQNAFYTASLARLPEYVGYTACYLSLLLGKLVSSTIVDALGTTGTKVPITWLRVVVILMVFAGTALFSSTSNSSREASEHNGEVCDVLDPRLATATSAAGCACPLVADGATAD